MTANRPPVTSTWAPVWRKICAHTWVSMMSGAADKVTGASARREAA
jgi:hypothetical protein